MFHILCPGYPAGRAGLGLLLLRAVTGVAFLFHGWPKIQNAFAWMDRPDAPSGVPGILQAAAAVSEFGGGAALILGVLTPLAALGIAATMVTAIGMVHLAQGRPVRGPAGLGRRLVGVSRGVPRRDGPPAADRAGSVLA
jgi:putative oxidoreductase